MGMSPWKTVRESITKILILSWQEKSKAMKEITLKPRSCAYSTDYKGSVIAVGAFYKAGRLLKKPGGNSKLDPANHPAESSLTGSL